MRILHSTLIKKLKIIILGVKIKYSNAENTQLQDQKTLQRYWCSSVSPPLVVQFTGLTHFYWH